MCALPGASPNLAILGGWGQRPQSSVLAARWPHRAVASAQRKAERSDGFSAFTGSRVAALFGATPPPHRQRRSIPALEVCPRRHGLCPRRGQRRPQWGGALGGTFTPSGVSPPRPGATGVAGASEPPKKAAERPPQSLDKTAFFELHITT